MLIQAHEAVDFVSRMLLKSERYPSMFSSYSTLPRHAELTNPMRGLSEPFWSSVAQFAVPASCLPSPQTFSSSDVSILWHSKMSTTLVIVPLGFDSFGCHRSQAESGRTIM